MIKLFLKDLRDKGLSQTEIAMKAGVTRSYLTGLSKGQNCSLETAIKFADAFGVSLDTVIGRKPPESHISAIEELLLKVTAGDEDITRAALRSAQGEKLIKEIEGEGRRERKVSNA